MQMWTTIIEDTVSSLPASCVMYSICPLMRLHFFGLSLGIASDAPHAIQVTRRCLCGRALCQCFERFDCSESGTGYWVLVHFVLMCEFGHSRVGRERSGCVWSTVTSSMLLTGNKFTPISRVNVPNLPLSLDCGQFGHIIWSTFCLVCKSPLTLVIDASS